MSLRLAVLLFVLVAFPASAQDRGLRPIAGQPSYTRMATECGGDPSRRSFSNSEYVQARKDAEAAIRQAEAGSFGQRDRVAAIRESIAQLEKCQDEERRKIPFPPIRTCDDLVREYHDFRYDVLYPMESSGRISSTEADQAMEHFREPARRCIREIFSKCIDPNKTSEVNRATTLAIIALDFGLRQRAADQTGADRFLNAVNPNRLQPKFCTETDYACKGDPWRCITRTRIIRQTMEDYYDY
jgi:hypothetical protein